MTINRRNFLNATASLTAAATVGVHTSSAAESKSTVNFALVGLGSLSTKQIAPALQKTQHAKLAGIVTGTPSKEKTWAEKYGIPQHNIYDYDTFDKLSENEEIDVVYIVLPNGMHHEFTIRGAKAGKHVLCEKPMANSAQECREMIAACDENTANSRSVIDVNSNLTINTASRPLDNETFGA
ncbi:Gfo/Idh/MocA family protein [Rhodopirellula sallentina]|uniref:Glucose-fructose oxidoreductase n=1 Tax=Rhodopirellula sallentina SM41 TaxID=1263870 RepID=M5UQX4_9BACT|nr:Gfo/Idh/MocA family oxidoreductase [Rhodopirellula sallentina]EMI58388.1 glucose-fructose oxidoreductase [Rhodopirellula sallentina SM41]